MIMSTGRNTPCPCGSGRKYKHCHGKPNQEVASGPEATWRNLRAALDGFPTKLLGFARQTYGPEVLDEAWDEFTLWQDDELGFDPSTMQMPLFMPWFFHRWAPDPEETQVLDESLHGRSPTRAFLERKGRWLDALLRSYLEACVESPFSFHEILHADPGRGFRARDVLTGAELDVLERSASRTASPGDLLFGQLVTVDGITLVEACSPHVFGPMHKLELIDFRDRVTGDGDADPHTVRDWDIEIREMYLDWIEELLNPSPPELRNTDGEPLVFHRVSFFAPSAHHAFEALKHLDSTATEEELLDSAELDDEGRVQRASITWTATGNETPGQWGNMVLGHLEFEGTTLVAEVNSAERAERIKATVIAAYPGAQHTSTEIETLEDARHRRDEAPAVSLDDSLASDPEVRAQVSKILEKHYEDWLRSPIPALGGRTPLDAVGDASGREKVRALLAQLERTGSNMVPPMDERLLQRLREELGLEDSIA